MISYMTEYETFYVTDRPANNDTQSVHPLPAHMHKDGHTTCQLLCQ